MKPHTYEYASKKKGNGWADPSVDGDITLEGRIEADLPGKPFHISMHGEKMFIVFKALGQELSEEEKSVLDGAYADWDPEDLVSAQKRLIAAIDAETESRIFEGFEYGGKTFSLSLNAQINLLGLKDKKDDLTYPYKVLTADDLDEVELADAAEAEAFYTTGFTVKETALGAGRLVKVAVKDAASIADAEAAASSYLAGN